MTNKLLGGLITLVIGVNLLPVLNDVVSPLTTTGGAFEATATGAMLDLLPFLFVIILVTFVVYMIPSKS
jgi:hypothetical protein